MKYPCNVIRDLLPLYHDDVCSQESKEMIQEHLSECAECTQYDQQIMELSNFPLHEQILEQEKAKFIQNIKRKILQKKIIVSVVSIVCAVVLVIVGYSYLDNKELFIPYDPDMITIAMDGNDICAYLKEAPNPLQTSSTLIETEQDGKIIHDLYFNFSTNGLYHILKLPGRFMHDTFKAVLAYDYIAEGQKSSAGIIDRIYYYPTTFEFLSELTFEERERKGAVLIWSRENDLS